MERVDPVLIRPGGPGDAVAVRALFVEAFRDSMLPFTVYADERSVVWLREVLSRETPLVAVAMHGDTLLGAFGGALQGTDWHLNYVAVRADERGRGIGGRLLDTFEAWGRARGATRFTLHVVESKADAVAWYTRHGYRRDERCVHVRLAIATTAARAPSFAPAAGDLEAALASVRRQGFGRFVAMRGKQRLDVGLVGDDTCRLLDAGSIPVEEAVAEVRALFAGRRGQLVLVGQEREPQVDGVIESWPAWLMAKRAGDPT